MKLQANQVVGNVKFNSKMEPFENMVLPLLWVDLTIDNLPVYLQVLVHCLKYVFPALQGLVVLGLILAGFYQLSSAFVLCFWSPPAGNDRAVSLLGALTLSKSFQHKPQAKELVQQEIQKLLAAESAASGAGQGEV